MTDSAPKSRSRVFIILILAVIVLGVAAFGAWSYFSGKESTDDAQVDGHINPVNAKIGGIVRTVNVKENQRVEAGQVLVQIDTRDYEIALARAQADLADAQANYLAARTGIPVATTTSGSRISSSQASIVRAQGGVETAQKDVDSAKARLNLAKARSNEAQANYTKAAKDVERLRPLVAKEEVSQQQFDAVVATADAAKAAVDSAHASILEAESAIAAAEGRVTQARGVFGQAEAEAQAANTGPQEVATIRAHADAANARVEQAKAAVSQAKLNLEYASIKAPVSGMVSRKSVEIGQVVQPGQPLLAVVSLDEVWITANFKETQLDKMKPGQPVTINVDAYDGAKFAGHVESIAAATGAKFSLLPPENASGNYVKVVQRIPVRIALESNADPQHVLRPGMSVVATVKVEPE
jgi:membrane fusion protein (multidrug efflux system)